MSGARGVALMTGAALVLTGLSLLGAGMTTASRTVENATTTAAVLVMVGDALVVAGFVFVWFSLRAAALAGLIALGVASLPVGVGLTLASPMIRQLDSPDLASERAANVALGGGVIFLLLGALFLLLAWLLSFQPGARGGLAGVGRFVGVGYGVLLFFSGLSSALVLPFSALAAEGSDLTALQVSVARASVAFALLVPGTLLILHGVSAAMGEDTTPSWVPPALAMALPFGLVLAAGTAATDVAAAMAPLHLLAAALPAAALLGLAAHGGLGWRTEGAWPTWRQVWLAVAFGMGVATAIASVIEVLAIGGVLTGFLSYHQAFQGLATLDEVGDVFRHFARYLSDREEMALALLLLSGVVPVVEEGAKGLGVRLLMTGATTRASVFAIGVAVGSSFGVAEALGYGYSAFEEGGDPWWATMLLRGGATSMHALATGLVGLGWYQAILRGKPGAGVLLYLAAVSIHGTWNGLIALVGTRFVVTWEGLKNAELERGLYALTAAMAVAALSALVVFCRRLRERPEGPA